VPHATAGSSGKKVTKDLQRLSGSTNFTKLKIYDIIKEKGEYSMPRKKKSETEVAETKSTKKKSTKKMATSTESLTEGKPVFNIAEVIEWTDEECKAKDKEFKFYVADMRNILRSLVAVNNDLVETQNKLTLLKSSLAKGLMTGYKIVCPHCKREYIVNSMELNRDSEVVCKVCGTSYKETENIDGIATVDKDESKETVII
jgi:hypothetical protein